MTRMSRVEKYKKRKLRIRKRIFGTTERPRLSIHKSLKHIYAQIINDEEQRTLIFCSSLSKEIKDILKNNKKTKKEIAKLVGEVLAKKAMEKGIEKVVLDRGGHLYHGRVKEMAEAARESGLKF
ncbi:MAG: 50S ribosomal protein L18 [Candidatus Hydrogenedentota bacterium]